MLKVREQIAYPKELDLAALLSPLLRHHSRRIIASIERPKTLQKKAYSAEEASAR